MVGFLVCPFLVFVFRILGHFRTHQSTRPSQRGVSCAGRLAMNLECLADFSDFVWLKAQHISPHVTTIVALPYNDVRGVLIIRWLLIIHTSPIKRIKQKEQENKLFKKYRKPNRLHPFFLPFSPPSGSSSFSAAAASRSFRDFRMAASNISFSKLKRGDF